MWTYCRTGTGLTDAERLILSPFSEFRVGPIWEHGQLEEDCLKHRDNFWTMTLFYLAVFII